MRILRPFVWLLIPAIAPAMAAQDAGGSYNLLLKASITDDWFVISRSNLATRNNFGDEFLAYFGASLGYQITPRLSLRFGYRRAWFRFGED